MNRRVFIRRISTSLGVALSPGAVAAILSGCRPKPGAAPAFLSEDAFALVASLADAIIPETDTPGAAQAGVPEYIDMILAEFSEDAERVRVRTQLEELSAALRSIGARTLDDLPADRRLAVMSALDTQAFGGGEAGVDAPFDLPAGDPPLLRTIKAWTVAGYYTSEVGALEELHQPPFGLYHGDIPFEEVGKTWA